MANLTQEQQQLIAIIRNAENGIKIGKIAELIAVPRRTLLRRLQELQKMQLIFVTGAKSGVRYFVANQAGSLDLSKTSQDLKSYLRQPLQRRKPVAYNRDFLYSYQPNKTFYLSVSVRRHLRKIGKQFNHEAERGTYLKRILHRLLVDLSWNSSRLEGNTYSLLETRRLIEYGATVDGKQAFEAQMIINHKEAIEFLVDHVDKLDIEQNTVLNIHALLANNLLQDPKARGRLRQIPVAIAKTVYSPPEIPHLIAEYFNHLLNISGKIQDPFEQALFVMIQFPYLQPFEDVNKRVSRIVANIPLIKNDLSPLSFVDVPKDDYINGLFAIYELNKIDILSELFVWAYERSAQQYKVAQDVLSEPNLVYMRFKNELSTLVNLVVSNNIRGQAIINTIQSWSKEKIPSSYQQQFVQLAEQEIASLHTGNIAVYHIDPKIFSNWQIK